MLDDLGLVHMNGRIYWALIGRFLSADQVVQDATYLQCYNRYSYCLNNPLRYTDPSGYISDEEARKLELKYETKFDQLHREALTGVDQQIIAKCDSQNKNQGKGSDSKNGASQTESSKQASAATERVSPATPNENSVPEVKSGEPDKLETAQTPKEEKPATKPADLNLFNESDKEHHDLLYPNTQSFIVAGHGTINGILDQGEDINNKTGYSPEELAERISDSDAYHGQDVMLYSCKTGVVPDRGEAFAQQLANNLGVNVKAPQGVLFLTDGSWSVYKSYKHDSAGNPVPVGNKADFHTFKPDANKLLRIIEEDLLKGIY